MRHVIALVVILLIIQAIALKILGQPLICVCNHIKLWEGVVLSSDNSQHISDWYSFSHLIHGFIFYFLSRLMFPRARISTLFLFSLGIEVTWEIIENTPMVIEHYRQQALAMGYKGDSIINSLFDSIFMMLGFLLAYKLPVWLSILIVIGLELWVGYEIRDNLTLNIINLIHDFPAIHSWQAGGD